MPFDLNDNRLNPDAASCESGPHLDTPQSPQESGLESSDKSMEFSGRGHVEEAEHGSREMGLTYLHPSSLLFDIIAHSRTYLVPIVIGLFSAANGNYFWFIISGVFFIPAVLVSVFRYLTLRYKIEDEHLIVSSGLLFQKTRTVPVSRIQNIDLVQNIIHRAFGVAEVKIETASGTEPEAVLRVLSMAQMEKLRAAIFGSSHDQSSMPSLAIPVEAGEYSTNMDGESLAQVDPLPSPFVVSDHRVAARQTVLSISVQQLVKAGLASNRGLIMVGVLVGGYLQFADGGYRTGISTLYKWLPQFDSYLYAGLIALATIVIATLALRLLGTGWYLLRFFNYQLERRGDDLRISCGLFTKVSATVPRKRIQFISIHRSLMMRWMGLASIRIETAGGSGDKQNATESVSKRWFVPVIDESEVPRLIATLRPGLNWDEDSLAFQPLAPRAMKRLMRIAILTSILLIAIGLFFSLPWGFVPGLLICPLLVFWARKQAMSMRYSRTDHGVIYRSGVLTRKISMTFFEKIQTLCVVQSPFDRRWGMAKLIVDTAAAGPADHQISVPYLDEEFVETEFQTLREKTGINQPVFG